MSRSHLPRVPPALSLAAEPLPPAPFGTMLGLLVRHMAREHPEILRRMGPHAERTFLIDPTDLPFVLLLRPATGALSAHRRDRQLEHDARLAGSLAAFLAMLHGTEDGDALFFSRDLTIEGDTEAVLALRNALDDAEIDLTEELATMSGPLAAPLRRALALAERISGLALRRAETTGDLT